MTRVGDCTLYHGDALAVLPTLGPGCVDAVVTDPPYGLGFMGKAWDQSGVAFDPETWAKVLRVLKPGGYLLAFGGSRTQHRIACAIEDAGFELRDCLLWLYGTGFPKGKGCLKPAYEPILLARRPGPKVLPLGIDGCRVPTTEKLGGGGEKGVSLEGKHEGWARPWMNRTEDVEAAAARCRDAVAKAELLGRWPANVLHDGSDEVLEAFAAFGERSGPREVARRPGDGKGYCGLRTQDVERYAFDDTGSAARFFYCAKASKRERGKDNAHPTVKPLALMRWLVRLACPAEGGTVLDPFGGSGTTGVAAAREGRRAVLVERDPDYFAVARRRVEAECAKTPLLTE